MKAHFTRRSMIPFSLFVALAMLSMVSPFAYQVNGDTPTPTYWVYLPAIFRSYFQPAWYFSRLDAPKFLGDLSSRSIDIKSNNQACIAYGNDHLYFSCWVDDYWVKSTADENFGVGRFASLAFDLSDQAHIAYYDETNGALKYAKQTAAGWSLQTVDVYSPQSTGSAKSDWHEWIPAAIRRLGVTTAKTGTGGESSIAVTNAGNPHISYYDYTLHALRYAFWNGSSWSLSTVDQSADVGRYSSIALDSTGKPRISYYDASNGDLKFASWNGSSWQISTVDTPGNVGMYTSLILTQGNIPCISYYYTYKINNIDYGHLKYAYWNGSNFNIYTLDSAGNVGAYTSLALKWNNKIAIGYYDVGNGDLLYWEGDVDGTKQDKRVVLDSQDLVGRNLSLAIDLQNNDHLAYYHASNNELRYKYQDITEAVDRSTLTGIFPNLKIDANGTVHIAHNNDSQDELRYMVREGSTWTLQIVDGFPNRDAGVFPSLGVTSWGMPAISYWQYDQQLKYAYKAGDSWELMVVDNSPGTGNGAFRSALALDPNGYPRIAYYHPVDTSLRVASWQDSSFYRETVDNSADVGDYPSIVTDNNGNYWIAYYDKTSSRLKIAQGRINAWNTAVVDASPGSGVNTAIGLDSALRPHIVYLSGTVTPILKHAWWNGAAWQTESIDDNGNAAGSISMSMTGDNLYVSYSNSHSADLQIAVMLGGGWQLFTVDTPGDVGGGSGIGTVNGKIVIAYSDLTNGDLKFAELK